MFPKVKTPQTKRKTFFSPGIWLPWWFLTPLTSYLCFFCVLYSVQSFSHVSFPVHHQLLELAQSQGCHPTISSSVILFSSCLQSSPVSDSFPVSQFSVSGGQTIGVSVSASVLPIRTDFLQVWLILSPCSPTDSRVFSNTTVQKHQFFGIQLSL